MRIPRSSPKSRRWAIRRSRTVANDSSSTNRLKCLSRVPKNTDHFDRDVRVGQTQIPEMPTLQPKLHGRLNPRSRSSSKTPRRMRKPRPKSFPALDDNQLIASPCGHLHNFDATCLDNQKAATLVAFADIPRIRQSPIGPWPFSVTMFRQVGYQVMTAGVSQKITTEGSAPELE